MSNFTERFKLLIIDSNYTLRELSKKINISSSQLSKYLSGNFEPSLRNSLTIANYFQCSLDYLFGLDEVKLRNNSKRDIDEKIFIERLLALIDLRKTNINRISKNTYINRNCIYQWQKLTIFPKVGILAKLARELDTSIEYLVGRVDIKGESL